MTPQFHEHLPAPSQDSSTQTQTHTTAHVYRGHGDAVLSPQLRRKHTDHIAGNSFKRCSAVNLVLLQDVRTCKRFHGAASESLASLFSVSSILQLRTILSSLFRASSFLSRSDFSTNQRPLVSRRCLRKKTPSRRQPQL